MDGGKRSRFDLLLPNDAYLSRPPARLGGGIHPGTVTMHSQRLFLSATADSHIPRKCYDSDPESVGAVTMHTYPAAMCDVWT
eukprot:1730905-Rhodomonas_salina.2